MEILPKAGCENFVFDDEDEALSDEPGLCINCRYRRWLDSAQENFVCLRH